MAKGKNFYIGIDVGGTFIKGGIVSNLGEVITSSTCATECELGNEQVLLNIEKLTKCMLRKVNLKLSDILGMGVGLPGVVDSINGVAVKAYNLNFNYFNIKSRLETMFPLKVNIINDANAFCLAEYFYGQGKGCNNLITLTLGTGVGGGAIVNGRLLEGNHSAGAEFGHMSIELNGRKCSCGRSGCFEQYVSATALTKDIKQAMESNPDSKMWEIGLLENASAKIAFDYARQDKTANDVIKSYVNYLTCGLANLANIFRPEKIILGGGIAKQGDNFANMVTKELENAVFASDKTPKVCVVTTKLGDNAGVLGAVATFINNNKQYKK